MKKNKPLNFKQLRKSNIERCEKVFHKLNDWSPTDWACAAAGEMGEACNFIKKMRRGQKIDINDIKHELGDIVCYVDLLAARLNIDLGEAVREKFNIVSNKKKCKIKL